MSYKVKKGTNNKETPQGGCQACLTARGHKRQLPPVPQRIPGAGPGAVPGPGQQPPDALVLQSLPVGGAPGRPGADLGSRCPHSQCGWWAWPLARFPSTAAPLLTKSARSFPGRPVFPPSHSAVTTPCLSVSCASQLLNLCPSLSAFGSLAPEQAGGCGQKHGHRALPTARLQVTSEPALELPRGLWEIHPHFTSGM